ncbi:ADPRH hydrolase, partial [Crypturellus soui]|nr:ADPRH hydrolase [Crypturellus soui]
VLLSGAGDALGYRGGLWEYCPSGARIEQELQELGGLAALRLRPPEWPLSDDTVLHLATAEALATGDGGDSAGDPWGEEWGSWGDWEVPLGSWGGLGGPLGILGGTSQLRPGQPGGYVIPFNPSGTGCGAAMRSLAIGLRYPHEQDLPTLVQVSVDSGRMTHHHPTG